MVILVRLYAHSASLHSSINSPKYYHLVIRGVIKYRNGNLVKKIVVIILVNICISCGGSSSSGEPQSIVSLFPSLLEDQRCFSDIDPDKTRYHRHTLRFTEDGYLSFGNSYFEDENCELFLFQYNEATYFSSPRMIGGTTTNQDGSIGTILLRTTDRDDLGWLSGTVYVVSNNQVCFAENTLTVTKSNINFGSVDIEGDVSGLSIDYENCLFFIDE